MRGILAAAFCVLCSGCAAERHFAADTISPFGKANQPVVNSETGKTALGKRASIRPILLQSGNVWPAPVLPMPTLSELQANETWPLGEASTPSLPSPYPLGQALASPAENSGPTSAPITLYSAMPGAKAQSLPPPDNMK